MTVMSLITLLLAGPMLAGLVINGLFLYLQQKGTRRGRCISCDLCSVSSLWSSSNTSSSMPYSCSSPFSKGNTFTINLNIAGIVTCCTTIPATLVLVSWEVPGGYDITIFCIAAAAYSMCINATNWTLFLINIERYYSISNPFKEVWITKRSGLCVSMVWFLSLLTFPLPFLENKINLQSSKQSSNENIFLRDNLSYCNLKELGSANLKQEICSNSREDRFLFDSNGFSILNTILSHQMTTNNTSQPLRRHNNPILLIDPQLHLMHYPGNSTTEFLRYENVSIHTLPSETIPLKCFGSLTEVLAISFPDDLLSHCLNGMFSLDDTRQEIVFDPRTCVNLTNNVRLYSYTCCNLVHFMRNTSNIFGIFIPFTTNISPNILSDLLSIISTPTMFVVRNVKNCEIRKDLDVVDLGVYFHTNDYFKFNILNCSVERLPQQSDRLLHLHTMPYERSNQTLETDLSYLFNSSCGKARILDETASYSLSFLSLIPEILGFWISLASQLGFVRAIALVARKKMAGKAVILRAAVAVTQCTVSVTQTTGMEQLSCEKNCPGKWRKKNSGASISDGNSSSISTYNGLASLRSNSKQGYPMQAKRMLKVAILIVMAYVVTSGSSALLSLGILVGDGTVSLQACVLTRIIAFVAPCINPFIYSFLRKQVRVDFMRALQRTGQLRRMTSLSLKATDHRSSLKLTLEKPQATPLPSRRSMPNIIYEERDHQGTRLSGRESAVAGSRRTLRSSYPSAILK